MLKGTSVNPRDYISWTSKISLREGVNMFENMFKKSSKTRKKVDNGLLLKKMVDRDALCPINVL